MTVEEQTKKEELNNDNIKEEIIVESDQNQEPIKQSVDTDTDTEIEIDDSNSEDTITVSEKTSSPNLEDDKSIETKEQETDKVENNINKNQDNNDETLFEKSSNQNKEPINVGHQIIKLFQNLLFTFIAVLILAFTVFTIANIDNSTISSGVSILGIDVSSLNRDEATEKISNYIQNSLENDIILKHNDFEINIGPEQLETKVKVASAIDAAFNVGSGNNIFSNSFTKLALLLKPVDIKPSISINNEQLEKTLNDISTQLPDAVKQSDYYIDGNSLIVTSGNPGVIVNIPAMSNIITTKLNDLSYINNPIEIVTLQKSPDAPNIEAIYNEVHKEATDAHFDSNTNIVYPEENGLDFDISLDDAKNILSVAQEEYTIPLKVLHPNVTTNMIGMEAFPDLLSTFSTKYAASNVSRTTNLKLAAGKVNGTVVLPGQTFSYNAVVGERTIAAGYKEAAVYQDGQVVNGLGGGICQISTTLYNAALYANLEIVERRNHQFVPSYIGAGRDATVVYGSQDFKFKNNRNYAIKITCSVDRGIATFNIHGIAEENDYEVAISSSITSRNANSFTSATYKTLRQNGEVVSSETISRDTYKTH